MKFYLWLFLGLVACSHSNLKETGGPRELKPDWIKNTYKGEIHTSPRVPHLMQPLVVSNFVFQGNGRDGLVAYNLEGQKAWRKDVEGGVQGAVFHDNVLYLGGGNGVVYALKATTGEEIWSHNLKVEILQAPTYHKGRLYVLTSNNTVHAFTVKEGEKIWSYARRGTFPPLNIYGNTTPLIYENNLLVGFSDGFLVSLIQENGAMVWEKRLSEYDRFKNLYIALDAGVIYVSSYEGRIYALDALDGKIHWSFPKMGGPSPITIHQDHIFFSTSKGDVIAANKLTGEVKWTYSLKNSIATRPLVFKNTVFVGQSDGPLLGLDKASGQHQISYRQVKGSMAPLTLSGERLYIMSKEGQLHALRIVY